MAIYFIKRVLISIPILIGISLITFFMIQAAPGDPSSMLIDPHISMEDKQRMKEALGLNEPVYKQYYLWLRNMMTGDFGVSFSRKMDVLELIGQRLPYTILLMGSSMLIASIIAIPLGVISATKQYSKLDYSITAASFAGLAIPNFWLGLILLMYFAVRWGLFPTGGVQTIGVEFHLLDRLHHLLLPVFVLASAEIATMIRYTRSSMLEVLHQDYMRTARAKGLKERSVIFRHGIRNGLIPLVTILGLTLPTFIGGSIIVEQIFSWPGLGKLFLESVFQRDYPVIMALTMLSAFLVVAGNLLADALYAVLDPRIQYGRGN